MGKVINILHRKENIVYCVNPESSVYDALELMVQKNVGALLVISNDEFLGIFTERDYARKVVLKGKASKETLVEEIMTRNPITVSLNNTIEDCMKLMTNKFIRHLPVLDRGRLIGIISIGDVVKYIIDEQKFIIENLEHYITGH